MDNWQVSQYSKSTKPISLIGILTSFCHYVGIPILTFWLAILTIRYKRNAGSAYCKVRISV